MVPSGFGNFFMALTGAGAALIGLLFVAISIRPESTTGATAPPLRQAVAASAFSALVNAFFIGIYALLPGLNIGTIVLPMSLIGILNSVMLGAQLARRRQWKLGSLRLDALDIVRSFLLVAGTMAVYIFELYNGIQALRHPHDIGIIYTIGAILILIYGLALTRAWELLGARRGGLLNFLNPLYELQEQPPSAPDEAPTRSAPEPVSTSRGQPSGGSPA